MRKLLGGYLGYWPTTKQEERFSVGARTYIVRIEWLSSSVEAYQVYFQAK